MVTHFLRDWSEYLESSCDAPDDYLNLQDATPSYDSQSQPDAHTDYFPGVIDVSRLPSYSECLPTDLAVQLFGKGAALPSSAVIEIPIHPGELESRLVTFTNLPNDLQLDDFRAAAAKFGTIVSAEVDPHRPGCGTVQFYNLRSAVNLRERSLTIRGRTAIVQYAPLTDTNTGTIVLINLPPTVPNDAIRSYAGTFGEIRELRGSPDHPNRFVEFWDLRSAAAARKAGKVKWKHQLGLGANSSLIVDFSKPGGFRANVCDLRKAPLPTVERSHKAALLPISKRRKWVDSDSRREATGEGCC
jgi:hypothetical protein